MLKFMCLLLLGCAHVLALPNIVDPHIVGGTPVGEGQFPFIVSLRDPNEEIFCGGGIVSERYIVTAAHCIEILKPDNLLVGVGSVHLDNQTMYEVERLILHPLWTHRHIENDIGLIELKKPLELSESVTALNFDYSESLDDKTVSAVGWGRTGETQPISYTLLHLDSTVISNKECSKRMGGATRIHQSNVCANGKLGYGMCFGDSGTPLVLKENGDNYAVGIVSWGVPCAIGLPDVFTRVSHYADWIRQEIIN